MAAAAREEAARQEAIRQLDLAVAKVQNAQRLLQQADWRESISAAYAVAEEATSDMAKATKSAKKAEKEVAVRVKEQAVLAARVERESAAAAEAERKETERIQRAEEDARKAHEERLARIDERGRLLAESKAKEERAEEERRQKRAEELRAAAAAAELKAAQKKAKEQKQLMEFEKKAKKQADEQAEKEALKAQKAALKAEHAKSTDDAKARKTEEARQGKLDVGSPSKLSIADRLRPDSTQRSGAGKVASQRLERSSYRLSFRQDELTPRSETEEDHDANQLTTFNAAVRGLAIDKRAAELLAQKLEEKKRKLQATQPPSWIKGWRKGASRVTDMEAEANFHGDTLSVGDDGDTLFCVDGMRLGVFSASSGVRVLSMAGHRDQIICVAALGDLVASAGRDRTIRLWSAATGECTATLEGSEDAIFGLSMFSDSILSGEKGGHARMWSISKTKCIGTFVEHSGNIIWSTALHDAAAVTASHDSTARVWPVLGDISGRTPSLGVLHHPEAVFSVSMVDDCVATACGDRIVRLWSLTTLTCTHTMEHGVSSVGDDFRDGLYPYCVHLQSRHVLVSGGGTEKTVKLWSLANDGSTECVATIEHEATVRGVAVSSKGFIASIGGRWKKLAIWRPTGWRPSASDSEERVTVT